MSTHVVRSLAMAFALALPACQAAPTPTPAPTFEPTATLAPASTATPTPTNTATSVPTSTATPVPRNTATPSPTPVPSLSGRVTDATTGRGIAGARVEAWLASQHAGGFTAKPWLIGKVDWVHAATTAADGRYALFGVPPGEYAVRVVAQGYARKYYDNVIPSHEVKFVRVTALRETPNISFALAAGGSMSGHIYQSDGVTPIAGAEVYVRPSKYEFDQGFWARTDSKGGYTVENLPLGDYRVTVQVKGYVELVHFYKNRIGWKSASDVRVTPPGNTPGVDINVDRAGSISGFVYAGDGVTPIRNAMVIAGNISGEFVEGFVTRSTWNGSYVIEGILPGTYRVRIQGDIPGWYAGEYYDTKYTIGTADRITVHAGQDTPKINFTLDEGGSITGRVFDQDTKRPLESIILFACLPAGGCTTPIVHTRYDGSYKFVLRPGTYLIGTGDEDIHLLGNEYLPEWYNDASDQSNATLVNVTLHHETSGIDFYLARSGSN